MADWPYTLLLLFKDRLERSGTNRFRLGSTSGSIEEHSRLAADPAAPDLPTASNVALFRSAPDVREKPVPQGCFVWGWWRKPWERHVELFAALRAACDARQFPRVLLYNQYERQLYQATVEEVHFYPGLTSVVLPQSWQTHCPNYYREALRLCGAFFALRGVERMQDPAGTLSAYVIAPPSFPFLGPDPSPFTIKIPEDLSDTCRTALYRPPNRPTLRSTDHTLLVLHRHGRTESIRTLLGDKAKTALQLDPLLSSALYDASWSDIATVLGSAPPSSWARLAGCPDALAVMARAALRAGAHITRFDLFLFSTILDAKLLDPLLVFTGDAFSALGESIRSWLTTSDARSAQVAARSVFESAWNAARHRYTLGPIDSYLKTLDSVESIIGTTKYEIAKKFYRDHLSHNVRAALLGVFLLQGRPIPLDDANPAIAAFYAGLYHDISLPLVTFASTVTNLAAAVKTAPFAETVIRGIPVLNSESLGPPLNYSVLLASIPDLQTKARAGLSWRNADDLYAQTDARLLHELTLCARRAEHAVVSAAMLFQLALDGRGGTGDGATSLLAEMLDGSPNHPHMREFLLVLQAAALHDRRPASTHWIAGPHRTFGATGLDWPRFPLPVTVAIADECQEWGRPIGAIEGMGAIDASVQFDGNRVSAVFTVSQDPTTFLSVPYSVLEATFGKLKTLTEHRVTNSSGQLVPLSVSVSLDGIDSYAARDRGLGPKLSIEKATVLSSNGKLLHDRHFDQQFEDDSILVSLRLDAAGHQGLARDYFVLTGSNDTLAAIRDQLTHSRPRTVSLDDTTLSIKLSTGATITGSIVEYVFGEPDTKKCSPANELTASPAGIAVLQDVNVELPPIAAGGARARSARRMMAPHILDYDWRFTDETCQSLVAAAQLNADRGPVCYLGCPTLALWDSSVASTDWRLLDRGHAALEQWVSEGLVRKDRWHKYDVLAELPIGLLGVHNVVMLDPPWYDVEYQMFLRRARQLVRSGGVIAVTTYPPGAPYDPAKAERFGTMLKREFYGCENIGAIEVSYEPPDFEVSWDGHRKFIDASFDVYRPSYVDFFLVVDPGADPPTSSPAAQESGRPLPRVLQLGQGQYLRVAEDLPFSRLYGTDGVRVVIDRRMTTERMIRSKLHDVIAWSTRNAIVSCARGSAGTVVRSDDELVRVVNEWEAHNR